MAGLGCRDGGHTGPMTVLLVVALAVIAWCLLMLPLAVAVGRAFQAGESDVAFERVGLEYEVAGV